MSEIENQKPFEQNEKIDPAPLYGRIKELSQTLPLIAEDVVPGVHEVKLKEYGLEDFSSFSIYPEEEDQPLAVIYTKKLPNEGEIKLQQVVTIIFENQIRHNVPDVKVEVGSEIVTEEEGYKNLTEAVGEFMDPLAINEPEEFANGLKRLVEATREVSPEGISRLEDIIEVNLDKISEQDALKDLKLVAEGISAHQNLQ